jgi:hypothetical protein
MPDEKRSSIFDDRRFRQGLEGHPSPALARRLIRAKAAFDARHPDRERAIAAAKHNRPHPFLVLAAAPGDLGHRPIGAASGLHSASVELVELDAAGAPAGDPVAFVSAGKAYRVRCAVTNRGEAPALVGLAEFYAATPAAFDAAALDPGATLPPLGYGGFSVPAGRTVRIACPNPWLPTPEQSQEASVLVQVYDPTGDFIRRRFDALNDRRVARLDLSAAPDFTGIWRGPYTGPVGKDSEVQVTLHQTGEAVTAEISFNSGSEAHAQGQLQGQEAVLAGGAVLPASPQSTNTWRFRFLTPSTLRLEHVLIEQDGTEMPGKADLPRVL